MLKERYLEDSELYTSIEILEFKLIKVEMNPIIKYHRYNRPIKLIFERSNFKYTINDLIDVLNNLSPIINSYSITDVSLLYTNTHYITLESNYNKLD